MANSRFPEADTRKRPIIRTLAIDVGGTGLKASVLDAAGNMLIERVRADTPRPCPPELLVSTLVALVAPLRPFDRVSVGFPGVVRDGVILTAINLGGEIYRGFSLAKRLQQALDKPVRILNDAEVQGLGIIEGKGLEVVITLGTGIGSAIFIDGRPTPHLELAHHPLAANKTYEQYLGNVARKKIGKKKWNQRLMHMIEVLKVLTNYDRLYLGGGNSAKIDFPLPENVVLASNDAGITGGIRLWDDRLWTVAHSLE